MAFSMFLRNSVVRNRSLSQQIARLVTQPTFNQSIARYTPATTTSLQDPKISTPIFNAVRSFQTTQAVAATEKPHDHARLWVIEKATSAILVAVIPAALVFPNKILDSIMAILITAHSFWGLEAIAVDYVRESIFGSFIPKIAIGLVYAISIATLAGLFYIISHDIGIANTVRSFWAIKSEQKS